MAKSASPLPWIGNKGCIYPLIEAFTPKHSIYLEACMGSGEVFFRREPSRHEILNDYNGSLINLFRVLQDNEKLAYLVGRLTLSVSSEELFRERRTWLEEIPNILDDLSETAQIISEASWDEIRQAAALYEQQVYSFSSGGKSFAIAKRDMSQRIPRLLIAAKRLQGVSILHQDYKEVISRTAKPGMFIYLDPPYRGTERYYSKSSFDENEHEKLFSFMKELNEKLGGRCKFLISYNNDPYIRELATNAGFDTYATQRLHTMSRQSGNQFEELLIANYDLIEQARENGIELPPSL